MKEYAKNVPKPKQQQYLMQSLTERMNINEAIDEEEEITELEKLEFMHNEYLQEMDRFKDQL